MLRVIETASSISVSCYKDGIRATSSVDNMGEYWWVSRVLVEPRTERGKGIGTAMLRELLQAVVRQGGVEVRVTPGGYDNDTKRQFKFYLKQGFQPSEEREMLVWRPHAS